HPETGEDSALALHHFDHDPAAPISRQQGMGANIVRAPVGRMCDFDADGLPSVAENEDISVLIESKLGWSHRIGQPTVAALPAEELWVPLFDEAQRFVEVAVLDRHATEVPR